MSAIGIAETPCIVIVLGEKQRRESILGGVLVKEPVYRAQEEFGMSQRQRALAAQIGLQVSHQESRGNPFAGYVTDDQTDVLLSQVKKVEIVASHLARLQANAGIFECLCFWVNLRKQACLDLLGDFDFLRGATLRFEFLGQSPALRFYGAGEFVESSEAEAVAVRIFEASVNPSPGRNLRRELKLHTAGIPLRILAVDVFGNEPRARLGADELGSVVVRLEKGQAEMGIAVRRGNFNPSASIRKLVVHDHAKAELIYIEPKTLVLVANKNDYEVQAEIRVLIVNSEQRAFNAKREFGTSHRRDYTGGENCRGRESNRTRQVDEAAVLPRGLGLKLRGFGEAEFALGEGRRQDFLNLGFFAVARHGELADQ